MKESAVGRRAVVLIDLDDFLLDVNLVSDIDAATELVGIADQLAADREVRLTRERCASAKRQKSDAWRWRTLSLTAAIVSMMFCVMEANFNRVFDVIVQLIKEREKFPLSSVHPLKHVGLVTSIEGRERVQAPTSDVVPEVVDPLLTPKNTAPAYSLRHPVAGVSTITQHLQHTQYLVFRKAYTGAFEDVWCETIAPCSSESLIYDSTDIAPHNRFMYMVVYAFL